MLRCVIYLHVWSRCGDALCRPAEPAGCSSGATLSFPRETNAQSAADHRPGGSRRLDAQLCAMRKRVKIHSSLSPSPPLSRSLPSPFSISLPLPPLPSHSSLSLSVTLPSTVNHQPLTAVQPPPIVNRQQSTANRGKKKKKNVGGKQKRPTVCAMRKE